MPREQPATGGGLCNHRATTHIRIKTLRKRPWSSSTGLRRSDCGAVHGRSRYSIDNFDPTSSISDARHLHGSPNEIRRTENPTSQGGSVMEGMSTNETTRLNQAVQTAIGTISGQSIGPSNQQFAEATESTTEPLRATDQSSSRPRRRGSAGSARGGGARTCARSAA